LPKLFRHRSAAVTTAVTGPARLDRRTKRLVARLSPGDVAVIDHIDLDRVAGDALIDAGAAVVINVAPCVSGRYPNGGPIRIVEAGIPLIDRADAAIFERLQEGDSVVVDGDQILVAGEVVAKGVALDREAVLEQMEEARGSIGHELRQFAANTLVYVEKEAELTFAPLHPPPLSVTFEDRHALIVVRGHDYREDLRALRPYIKEYQPVLVAVDGGADALLDLGFTPDIIIGDFDSVSDEALATGADLVHHVHPDGRGPGREELHKWGQPYVEFVVEGTSEDAAMLMAYELHADLIVAVGTHATMVEFLDKGRPGMASTFLTRLRLGPILVDAKGVSRLYEGRVRRTDIALLIGAGLLVIVVMLAAADTLHVFVDAVWLTLRDLWFSIF
jgi:uncharacterized membrane-anchored protein